MATEENDLLKKRVEKIEKWPQGIIMAIIGFVLLLISTLLIEKVIFIFAAIIKEWIEKPIHLFFIIFTLIVLAFAIGYYDYKKKQLAINTIFSFIQRFYLDLILFIASISFFVGMFLTGKGYDNGDLLTLFGAIFAVIAISSSGIFFWIRREIRIDNKKHLKAEKIKWDASQLANKISGLIVESYGFWRIYDTYKNKYKDIEIPEKILNGIGEIPWYKKFLDSAIKESRRSLQLTALFDDSCKEDYEWIITSAKNNLYYYLADEQQSADNLRKKLEQLREKELSTEKIGRINKILIGIKNVSKDDKDMALDFAKEINLQIERKSLPKHPYLNEIDCKQELKDTCRHIEECF